VEMVELNIEIDNDLIAKTRDLALRYFGDDGDASLAQVLEVAFTMRCLWSHSVKEGQLETDDAVSKWEFAESPVTQEKSGTIRHWLFRR
jgi:hypothetical protein